MSEKPQKPKGTSRQRAAFLVLTEGPKGLAVTPRGVPSPSKGYLPGEPVAIKELGLTTDQAKQIEERTNGLLKYVEKEGEE